MRDPFGRSIEYLRISVTDKCNFRCFYCMPAEGVPFLPHESILRFEEIVEVARTALTLGITRFRLTGGEPLIRRGIVDLVRKLAALDGIEDLAMTTNGALLAGFAADLKAAGLRRVNISLDTMDPDRFRDMTRGGDIGAVLTGIEAADREGLHPVKLNIVVEDPARDEDARSVEEFARRHGYESRRIRMMNLGAGRFSVVENSTRGDCALCNRLRLTCDGFVRSCLMSRIMFSVRELGAEEALRRAIAGKPEHGSGAPGSAMNRIGG